MSGPTEKRSEIRSRLLKNLSADYYLQAATEISLSDAARYAEKRMSNTITDRTLVNVCGYPSYSAVQVRYTVMMKHGDND